MMSDFSDAKNGWADLCNQLGPAILTDATAHALMHAANQVIGEADAEIQRLMAELDKSVDHIVIMAPERWAVKAMEDCKGEEPGTILRTTDTHDEWVLGSDQEWHQK